MSPIARTSAKRATLAVVAALLWVTMAALPARSDDSSVRAVLFYSPTCPHCHQVMTEDLPPIMDRFGGRLQVLLVDVSVPAGGHSTSRPRPCSRSRRTASAYPP
jgi:hypothetical protein